MKRQILIINGPNLNLTGKREPDLYGHDTMEKIIERLRLEFSDIHIEYFQSNSEGAIIDKIHHTFLHGIEGVVINPGALGHYSYALADALGLLKSPKIEVHISNIFARDEFRHKTVTAGKCDGVIAGLGTDVYRLALIKILSENN